MYYFKPPPPLFYKESFEATVSCNQCTLKSNRVYDFAIDFFKCIGVEVPTTLTPSEVIGEYYRCLGSKYYMQTIYSRCVANEIAYMRLVNRNTIPCLFKISVDNFVDRIFEPNCTFYQFSESSIAYSSATRTEIVPLGDLMEFCSDLTDYRCSFIKC